MNALADPEFSWQPQGQWSERLLFFGSFTAQNINSDKALKQIFIKF
jgi:hypothetical protein